MSLAYLTGNLEFLIGLLAGFAVGVGLVTVALVAIYLVEW